MNRNDIRRRRQFLAGTCAFAALLAGTNAAYAQTAEAPAAPGSGPAEIQDTDVQPAPDSRDLTTQEAADTGEITVTASRVKRNGYTAPTPETVFGAAELAIKAPTNIADALNQLPQLSGSASPRQATVNLSSGSSGANFLNLRGLGTNRTLVLLDGRRVVGANVDGRVDVNTLPSALISRVDIVTGGASAAYGSDAVSGVVNFVLDTKFKGIKVEGQSGITTYGDDFTYKFDAAAGQSFADDRGHVVLSGTYAKTAGIDRSDSRPWFNGAKIIPNPAFVTGNGQPTLVYAENVSLNASTPGGIFTSGALRGTQFGNGGAISQHAYGVNSNIYSIGGEPNDLAASYALDIPVEQITGFAHVSYEFSDALKVFGEFNYGRALATAAGPFNFHNGNLTIQRDNAFLPMPPRIVL